MSSTQEWFAVDKEGLSKLLEERGAPFAVLELIQNALDTNAKNISIDLAKVDGRRGLYDLTVIDDDPDGFSNLAHAFTLFAESEKKGKVNLRGRFNLGEKLVLALCESAVIRSTRGAVRFDDEGRHDEPKGKTEVGSEVDMQIRLTADDAKEVKRLVHTVLIPEGVAVTYNGEPLEERKALRVVSASLPTIIATASGALKNSSRKTEVRLVEPKEGEKPHLYELGIPVVEIDVPFHCDVQQKVPLGFNRDAVTPAYARALHVAVVNQAPDLIATADNVTRGWVGDALESPDITPDAVRSVLEARFEDLSKVVVYDPTDREAKTEAQSLGYEVIGGRTFTGPQWENIRQHVPDLLPRAGLVAPSRNSIMRTGEEEIQQHPERVIDPKDWTERQRNTAVYAQRQATWLLGRPVRVRIVKSEVRFLASWGASILTLNAAALWPAWWSNEQAVDEIVIHEVAHDKSNDHLDHKFYEEVIRLGAKLRNSDLRLI